MFIASENLNSIIILVVSVFSRWWDKCIQLIVSESAVSGANVEHSALDATVS